MKNITRRNMVAAIGAAGAGTCVCGMNGSKKKGLAKKPLRKYVAALDPTSANLLVITL